MRSECKKISHVGILSLKRMHSSGMCTDRRLPVSWGYAEPPLDTPHDTPAI